MVYRRITAIEAAEMINDGDMMALSGFTPNGNPKAIFRELSKRAVRLMQDNLSRWESSPERLRVRVWKVTWRQHMH